MSALRSAWFWLLLLSLIGLILSFIFFELYGTTVNGVWTYPDWVWILFIVSIFIFALAFILFCMASLKKDCEPKAIPMCNEIVLPQCMPTVPQCLPEKPKCIVPEKPKCVVPNPEKSEKVKHDKEKEEKKKEKKAEKKMEKLCKKNPFSECQCEDDD